MANLFTIEIQRVMNNKSTILLLAIFSVAMALLESAVVVYMRYLYYENNPLEIFPLQFLNSYDTSLELSREASTVVMILTVALLAERSTRTRAFAAFVFVFGVWDIFYYVWLKVLMGWPTSWLEWDVLFLIPSIWLGPWICPVLISLLFIAWGFWCLQSDKVVAFTFSSLGLFVGGATIGVASFLQPAMAVLSRGGIEELTNYTPGVFWWWLFLIGFALMSWGLGMTVASARPSTSQASQPLAE